MIKLLQSKHTVKILLSCLLLALLLGAFSNLADWYRLMQSEISKIPTRLALLFVFELTFFLLFFLFIWFPKIFNFILPLRNHLKAGSFVLTFGLALAYLFLRTHDVFYLYSGFYTQVTLFVILSVVSGIFFSRASLLSWKGFFAGQIIFFSFLTLLYALILTTDSPFSAAWSEGNRIWEYSTFFASNRYNTATTGRINTLTDIGRTSLWGIPFLISNISIKWVRIWSIFVFSVPYMIFGWVAFGFEKKKNLTAWAVLGIATYLFFNEAPIYTPLALAALLVALTRKSSLWLAVPVLILASYYVTTSRYTWIFAPGMWAITCAFLDQDFSLQPGIWANWKKSILLGISALFGGLVIPPLVNPFLSSSHASAGSLTLDTFQEMGSDHPLMWDRLFPNPTHGQGILLNLTIVTLPLILLILLPIFTKKWKLNVWQKLVLFGFPALFLAVGLVISTKVGGGGNLHNLDMFFISLLFLLVLSWNHGLREMIFSANPNNKWAFALIFAFILAPAWATMKDVRPITHIVPQSEIDEALAAVVSQVEQASQKGSVLFIDQRQLITFGEVGYLPLVTEYEKKVLMNAAMANNESYFERYYNDLKSRRFSLIVTEPITINFQSAQQSFQYENNAWVKWVSIPTTCYYESIYRSDEFRIELLVPREKFLRYANGYRCPE